MTLAIPSHVKSNKSSARSNVFTLTCPKKEMYYARDITYALLAHNPTCVTILAREDVTVSSKCNKLFRASHVSY
jgi:hypothetical protein